MEFRRMIRKASSIFMAALLLTLSFTSYSSNSVSALNTSIEYTVFHATTDLSGIAGQRSRTYTLAANALTDNSRAVFPPTDSRHSDNSIPGVVRINGDVTGFVVDDYTIATAAHCVFDEDNGTVNNSYTPISSIEVLDENGIVVERITNANEVHIPTSYINCVRSGQHEDPYDYAMITVSTDLSDYANFNLGIATDDMIGSDYPVYVTGFPSDRGARKYTGIGALTTADGHNYESILLHQVDTYEGNSGSPLYTYTKYNGHDYYTVIGIHAGYYYDYTGTIVTHNYAVRMTTNLLHFYKNNPNI